MPLLRFQSLAGFFILALLAWMISENRKKVEYKPIVIGLAFQLLLALVLIKLPFSQSFFMWLNNIVSALQESTAGRTSQYRWQKPQPHRPTPCPWRLTRVRW